MTALLHIVCLGPAWVPLATTLLPCHQKKAQPFDRAFVFAEETMALLTQRLRPTSEGLALFERWAACEAVLGNRVIPPMRGLDHLQGGLLSEELHGYDFGLSFLKLRLGQSRYL